MLHLASTVFILWLYPNESPSNTPLMYTLQTVEKAYQELLKVSNFANVLSLLGYMLCINMWAHSQQVLARVSTQIQI